MPVFTVGRALPTAALIFGVCMVYSVTISKKSVTDGKTLRKAQTIVSYGFLSWMSGGRAAKAYGMWVESVPPAGGSHCIRFGLYRRPCVTDHALFSPVEPLFFSCLHDVFHFLVREPTDNESVVGCVRHD